MNSSLANRGPRRACVLAAGAAASSLLVSCASFYVRDRSPAGLGHDFVDPSTITLTEVEQSYDAVVLRHDRTVTVSDELKTIEENRVSLFINTSDGLGYAELKLVSDGDEELSHVRARTITPEGDLVPIAADMRRESHEIFRNGKYAARAKVIAFPAATAGSIVEYSYAVKRNLRGFGRLLLTWDIPVRSARVTFRHGKDTVLKYRRNLFAKHTHKGGATFEAKNILPEKHVPYAPPIWQSAPWVSYVVDRLGVRSGFDSWSAAAERLRWPTSRARHTLPRRARISGYASAREGMKHLWKLAQQGLHNRDVSYRVAPANTTEQVASGYGTATERAWLMYAALREADATATILWLPSWYEQDIDNGFPNPIPLDAYLIKTKLDGEPLYLDPSCLGCAMGEIGEAFWGRDAVEVFLPDNWRQPVKAKVVTVPTGAHAEIPARLSANLRITARGIAASGAYEVRGQRAADMRHHYFNHPLTEAKRQEMMRKEYLDGVVEGEITLVGVGEPKGPVRVQIKDVLWRRHGYVATDRWFKAGLAELLGPDVAEPIDPKRVLPVAFRRRPYYDNQIRLQIPKGFTVLGELPQAQVKSSAGEYGLSTEKQGDTIIFSERLALARSYYAGVRLEELQALLGQIRQVRRTSLVLHKRKKQGADPRVQTGMSSRVSPPFGPL